MDFEQLKQQFNDLIEQIKIYFSQLNQNEKYGWVAEGVGTTLVLIGIVLFFI